MALAAFIDHTGLTIVGEPPRTPLQIYGGAISRRYPRTGLRLQVSTLRHQSSASEEISKFFPVDVPARFSFTDYGAGRDPAVDPILRG